MRDYMRAQLIEPGPARCHLQLHEVLVVELADVLQVSLASLRPEVLEAFAVQGSSVEEARQILKAAHSDKVWQE